MYHIDNIRIELPLERAERCLIVTGVPIPQPPRMEMDPRVVIRETLLDMEPTNPRVQQAELDTSITTNSDHAFGGTKFKKLRYFRGACERYFQCTT